MNITRFGSFLPRLALALMLSIPLATAPAAPQETFATPEAAVDALMAALKADTDAAMLAIFGEEHKDLIVSLLERSLASLGAAACKVVWTELAELRATLCALTSTIEMRLGAEGLHDET